MIISTLSFFLADTISMLSLAATLDPMAFGLWDGYRHEMVAQFVADLDFCFSVSTIWQCLTNKSGKTSLGVNEADRCKSRATRIGGKRPCSSWQRIYRVELDDRLTFWATLAKISLNYAHSQKMHDN